MTDYKVIEEHAVTLDLTKLVKWIHRIKKEEDQEIHIDSLQRRKWIILHSEDDRGVLLLSNYEIVMEFDDVETDGYRIVFYLQGLEICSMYPMIGWVARRVLV